MGLICFSKCIGMILYRGVIVFDGVGDLNFMFNVD